MRSSRRWLASAGAGVAGAIGVLMLTVPLMSDETATAAPLIGLVLLAVAAALWIFGSAPRVVESAITTRETADGPELHLRLRPHVPVANVLVLGALSALVLYGALAIGLRSGGLLLLPVLLLVALPLPDTVRALLRRPDVTLTNRHVALRGWGADAQLAWEDVTGAEVVVPRPRRPVVRILGRPGATSWTFAPRRILVPLDTRPDGPHVDVPILGLARPGALQVVVEELAAQRPDERAAFLRETAPQLLSCAGR